MLGKNSVITQAGMPMRKNKTTCVLCQNIQTTIVTRVVLSPQQKLRSINLWELFVRIIEQILSLSNKIQSTNWKLFDCVWFFGLYDMNKDQVQRCKQYFRNPLVIFDNDS